ncbi:MAG: PQQ-binding-like beta-propeller repeat protein [Candidatus Bathyarchaeota archaeon]|nr:PQQ-binding-like beta-propeller repeat protein [Candidatus Bathyarchaeota archaeon]
MKIKTNLKTKASIALILMLTIAIPLFSIPTTNGQTSAGKTTTHPMLTVNPNPVGVGQPVNIVMWVGMLLPSASVTNDIRFHDYTLTITKPDGKTETMKWAIVQDTTSTQYTKYTPDQVGTYTLNFSYPDQVYTWNATAAMRTWTNHVFLGASKTVTLTVQEEQLPEPISSYPLPTEYWTRPIEGQNTDWWAISSHWLGCDHPLHYNLVAADAMYQPDGTAPNSPHVMWTKRIDEGGVVGGSFAGIEGEMYYSGSAYQPRFYNPIIMNGLLFYAVPSQNSMSGGGYMCVDLHTGEKIWFNEKIGVDTSWPIPSFGYLYSAHTENQHGAIPNGVLFSSNFAVAYEPWTGQRLFNVTNVPSGMAAVGPQGEILRYQINIASRWLAQWNSSRLWSTASSGWVPDWNTTNGWVNASTSARYDWNVSIPTTIPTNTSPFKAICDDILLGSTSFSGSSGIGTPNPYTMWAISLKPESRGQLMWLKQYDAPPDNVTRMLRAVDPVNRVIIMLDKETFQYLGYSMDTGNYMWTTAVPAGISDFAYFDSTHGSVFCTVDHGVLYNSGFGGVLYAYDTKDGKLLWTYGNGGEGNSTFSGFQTPWGNYPQFISNTADGKVFLFSGEHSPNTPLYKGLRVRAVNATTGEEIWTLLGSMGYPPRQWYPVADGFIAYHNMYDGQIYCIGKGPSAVTVDVPMTAAALGQSVVIRGTVTDIAAGTKQTQQAARFPNGVPAVSDESQGEWMEYVYMQKPRPTNVTGVPIVISVLDANNNYREIGTVTSDADGFYSLSWKPDIEGKYTVYASFGGSESYWPSHAVTAFTVDPAPPTPAPTQPVQTSMADIYLVPGIAAIIVAIAIVGAMIMLMLRKRP